MIYKRVYSYSCIFCTNSLQTLKPLGDTPKCFLKAEPSQKGLVVRFLRKHIPLVPFPQYILRVVGTHFPHDFHKQMLYVLLVLLIESGNVVRIDKLCHAPRNTPVREYLGEYPLFVRVVIPTPYHEVTNRLCERAFL